MYPLCLCTATHCSPQGHAKLECEHLSFSLCTGLLGGPAAGEELPLKRQISSSRAPCLHSRVMAQSDRHTGSFPFKRVHAPLLLRDCVCSFIGPDSSKCGKLWGLNCSDCYQYDIEAENMLMILRASVLATVHGS